MKIKEIGLLGNPNVGKSTIFNTLTGKKEHTGNWSGKTIDNSYSKYKYNNKEYIIYDLPGTYSLLPNSKEEEVTKDFILSNKYDLLLIICDATCLNRNLNLVLQTLEITNNVIVVINLIDEAKKKKIDIDKNKLEEELKVPIVFTSARNNIGIKNLLDEIEKFNKKENILKKKKSIKEINKLADEISSKVITYNNENYNNKTIKTDKILTSKIFGIPILLLSLLLIFYITISLSNYPSNLLSDIFNNFSVTLNNFFIKLNINKTIIDILINGIYKTTTWVIAVMLPPMVIFFSLFSLLEDIGLLPRIAFNLDKIFNKCNSCGKQALTMCMGFGCNAVGVTSTRIIDSKKERLIAIITNSITPCNGRFPTIIAIITMFFVNNKNSILSSILLTAVITFSIIMTFITSKILSKTILKGYPSSFTLELPPYRKPLFFKVIIKSIYEKVIKILSKAVYISILAGLIIWILSNIKINNLSLLTHLINILDPIGKSIGLDGVILAAFILGFPANEIVIPIMLMGYLNTNNMTDYNSLFELKNILINNGWTIKTAICTIIFTLMHFPCSTTCLTIKKETKSFKWLILSILVPLILGISICFIISNIL